MDENKTTQNNDCAVADFNNGLCIGLKASPKETLAMQLRLMMKEAEGDDKCTLCKAAEELSKPENQGFNSYFSLLMLMLLSPWGGDVMDTDGMKAYMDAVEKKNKKSD